MRYEYAAVFEDEWDSGVDLVHIGSREATEEALRNRRCYDITSSQRHRDWMTEFGRRPATECGTDAEQRFVLVRLKSFQGSGE